MNKQVKSSLMLLLTAMIWGSGFVAQKAGTMLEPFTYNGIRNIIGGLAVLLVLFIFRKNEPDSQKKTDSYSGINKMTLVGGICCGIFLCIASNLQQFGLYYETDAGKAGFITSLYIVFVPVLGIFAGKKIKPLIWFCVGLGAAGFYLLTMAGSRGSLEFQLGDLLILICAVVFSGHIMVIDHFSSRCDGILLACIQFLFTGIVSVIGMFLFEHPVIGDIVDCAIPILYCGLISSGVGYTFQILGQKDADPTVATLVMSLESVFAVIFGVTIMGEHISPIEGFGCAVIFAAVLIPQLAIRE